MIRIFIICFLLFTVAPAMGETMEKQIEEALENVDSSFMEINSRDPGFVNEFIKNKPLIQGFIKTHNRLIPEGKEREFEKIIELLIDKQADLKQDINGRSVLYHTIFWDMKEATASIIKRLRDDKVDVNDNLATYLINSSEMLKLLIGLNFGSIDDLDADGNTLLHIAVGDNQQFHKEYIEYLLSKIDIESKNNEGQTPLIYTIGLYFRTKDVIRDNVELLVKKGADLEAWDAKKNTPLLEALRSPRTPKETIELLLNKTEDFKIENIGGMTPLCLAVVHYPEYIETLYHKDPAALNKAGDKRYTGGDTPLIKAIKWSELEGVVNLIKLGADVNKADSFGGTPLYYAKYKDFAEIISLLESKGAKDADPEVVTANIKKYRETRPPRDIDEAIELGRCTEYADFIKNELKKENAQKGKINTYFRRAGAEGSVPCVKLFLDLGADLKHKDDEGFDILMDALYYGNFELLKYLHKDRKIDLSQETSPSLLELAATTSSEVFEYMTANGAKVDDPQKYFDRAVNFGGGNVCQYLVDKYDIQYNPVDSQKYLDIYIKNEKSEFVKFYINNGGDINVSVRNFVNTHSLLSYALIRGEKDLALFLLEKGIDTKNEEKFSDKSFEHLINLGNIDLIKAYYGRKDAKEELEAKDSMGRTPLLWALELKRSEIAKLLISLGSDVNAMGPLDKTPLHLSVENGFLETTRLLLEKGAYINALDYRDRIPFDIATEHGYSTLQTLLEQYQTTNFYSD